ncbi:MAG: Bax inhibitor-1/YccA family protein [Clostridia bacterium]|nr:Bax inhibitor-1/YccA family protein [Clostridia bacterium]
MAQLSYNNGGTAHTRKKRSFLSSNPVMRRLNNVDEYSETDSATYSGITLKTGLFLLFTLGGVIIHLGLENALAVGQTFDINYKGFTVTMYTNEAIALIASVVLAIVFQLLAFFVRSSTPVSGALYCITQGYFISFLIFKVLKGYEYLGGLALLITMLIVLTMAGLYSAHIIRVTKKFKTVMITLVVTMVATSIFTFIGYFIPFTRQLVQSLAQNYVLSIAVSVIFIIIASLFLICDFDTIENVVENKLPKKYEWQAAFGLAFTVVWIYLKVLELIITIAGKKKN